MEALRGADLSVVDGVGLDAHQHVDGGGQDLRVAEQHQRQEGPDVAGLLPAAHDALDTGGSHSSGPRRVEAASQHVVAERDDSQLGGEDERSGDGHGLLLVGVQISLQSGSERGEAERRNEESELKVGGEEGLTTQTEPLES